MNDIKTNAVARAVALLNAAGAQFKVIYGDTEFGDLVVAPPKTGRRNNPKYPHGERTTYIKSHLEGMGVGDVRNVPYDPYPIQDLCTMVSPTAMEMWGKGAYQTQMTDKGIDVLRVL